jgi:hypothetical protein
MFNRVIEGLDLATGTVMVDENYSTSGPTSIWHVKNQCPPAAVPQCYILAPQTCTADVLRALDHGCASVTNWIATNECGV